MLRFTFFCLAHPGENVRQKQRTERLDFHLASSVRANSNQGTDSLPGRSHEAACDVLVVDVDRDHLYGRDYRSQQFCPLFDLCGGD